VRRKALKTAIACAGILTLSISGWSQTAPDNTRLNATERAAGELTADQQSNSKADVELISHIRRSIVKDSSLSVLAHNIKIISVNGAVTLKGPVKNNVEKASIGEKAEAIAGADKVDNQLEVENQ
jgi:hyperosmotically inducible periplasmic protein